MVDINWNLIRPLNGKQADGFEELCAQLARIETPTQAEFIRKAPPDAGVECFAVFPDEKEWAWQAKYFSELKPTQWQQINKSVETALGKHPKMDRYYICVPLDRSDARVGRRKSVLDHWNTHVLKWEKLAQKRKMNVTFIWWGYSELLDRLTQQTQRGRLRFWFDAEILDEMWFQRRQEDALASAGPRYSPELNVELPILQGFDAFAKTRAFYESFWALARPLHEQIRSLGQRVPAYSTRDEHKTMDRLVQSLTQIWTLFSKTRPSPDFDPPLVEVKNWICSAEDDLDQVLDFLSNYLSGSQAGESDTTPSQDSVRYLHTDLRRIGGILRNTCTKVSQSIPLVENTVLLLQGDAGTGKTHLLCDLTVMRNKEGLPTILLTGQSFTGSADAWTQAMHLLGLQNTTPDEFVGVLEAAAQAADAIALVVIDALNESNDKTLWRNHLSIFLSRLEQSKWIKTIVSVRSSYTALVIPDSLAKKAHTLEHRGFSGREYEAVSRFFGYYGLESPSTPVLIPDYSNPLFLKTLCEGLKKSGTTRLPRGFHGITKIFDFYLNATNSQLATRLDFDPKDSLLKKALQELARLQIESETRSLPRDVAKNAVNKFLEGRDHGRSLYFAILSEGLLLETPDFGSPETFQEHVLFAYERLGDYIVADLMLDQHLEPDYPEKLFTEGGALASFRSESFKFSAGLIEAYCMLLPERSHRELSGLIPEFFSKWHLRDGFRKSLIWRSTTAFSDETIFALNDLCRSQDDLLETLDVLLTVSAIPGHRLNSDFLHRRLIKEPMPERDRWWSTFLALNYGEKRSIDKLVDWASSIRRDTVVEGDTVRLVATSLAWFLSTPNRVLRDKATKALVCMLTGRLDSVCQLVEQFSDVNDPYILERVYAVAYGVSMRSHCRKDVGHLADVVYSKVFADGTPPVHVLLRDYSRGTIERAVYLGSNVDIDLDRVRPPYGSPWPTLPSQETINSFSQTADTEPHKHSNHDMARGDIVSSVLHLDFARYIIGTNSGDSEWLSLLLDHRIWLSGDERSANLLENLDIEQAKKWKAYEESCDLVDSLFSASIATFIAQLKEERLESNAPSDEYPIFTSSSNADSELETAEAKKDAAYSSLIASLSDVQRTSFERLYGRNGKGQQEEKPRFNLKAIQNYILWRVFDLGWTAEYFGFFDNTYASTRETSEPRSERFGKKYQWIALHEILAYVADNFQFFDGYGTDVEHEFKGPWQIGRRDIDPSWVLSNTPGGTRWHAHTPSWWGPTQYDRWERATAPKSWAQRRDDLPSIPQLLKVTDSSSNTTWLNLYGSFNWEQAIPSYLDEKEVEKRDLWFSFKAYLVRKYDLGSFIAMAADDQFIRECASNFHHELYRYVGEYGWATSFQHLGQFEWRRSSDMPPIEFRLPTYEFHVESSGADASIEDSHFLRLPEMKLIEDLGLIWTADGAKFEDCQGELICFDPTVHQGGPTAFLFREDRLREYLDANELALCWLVLGEKRALSPGFHRSFLGELAFHGAYTLGNDMPEGKLFFKDSFRKSP